jgi:hypothetical protein
MLNSRLIQMRAMERTACASVAPASGRPNSDGITTVNPRPITSSAKAMTFGVMPGTSWITITPGPLPLR